jgi:hypothetical protein
MKENLTHKIRNTKTCDMIFFQTRHLTLEAIDRYMTKPTVRNFIIPMIIKRVGKAYIIVEFISAEEGAIEALSLIEDRFNNDIEFALNKLKSWEPYSSC